MFTRRQRGKCPRMIIFQTHDLSCYGISPMETKQRMDMKIRLCLAVHKGMEWNDHKRMEMNGMECI